MTIQVVDDAVYEEWLQINDPDRQRNVVLEATNKATIRRLAPNSEVVWIQVPGFTLRGFRLERSPGPPHSLVNLTKSCSGVILDQLEMAPHAQSECVDIHDRWLQENSAPIVIQNCTMRGGARGFASRGTTGRTAIVLCPAVTW
jgi:hypothetical protein